MDDENWDIDPILAQDAAWSATGDDELAAGCAMTSEHDFWQHLEEDELLLQASSSNAEAAQQQKTY